MNSTLHGMNFLVKCILRSREIKKHLLISSIIALSLTGIAANAAMTPEVNALYQEACSEKYKNTFPDANKKLKKAITLAGNDSMLYTKLAGIYSDLGEYDLALQAYSKVLELKPDDAFVYISVGSIYETQGKYKEALAAYNKAIQIFPEYKYNYLNIANVQYKMQDYKTAVESYGKFLEIYPQHREARENIASAYLVLDMPEKAVKEYTTLYNKNNSSFRDYANYGIALVKTGDYSKGSEILEKAVELDPENTSCHISLALAYQELGNNDLALEQYAIVFKQLPNLHSIRLDYANLLADMKKNAEAIEQYKIYSQNYPTDARAYKNMAIVYKRMNDLDSAIANFEKTLAIKSDDTDVKKDLAECYHAKKDYISALKYYDEVLKVKPDDLEAKTNKAFALHALDQYDEAIALYEEVLSIKSNPTVDSNLTKAIVAQGFVSLNAKNYSKASEYFQKAVARNSADDYAYYGLAKSLRGLGVNDKASEMYEKAIALNPEKSLYSTEYGEFISSLYSRQQNVNDADGTDLPEISLNDNGDIQAKPVDLSKSKDLVTLGDENYRKKDFDLAVKNYQEALAINPNDEVTLLKIGNIYGMKNDNKTAAEFYKRAIVVKPDYADGWFNLGLAYANEKNYPEAKKSFGKVVELKPDYAYAYYALAIAYETEENKPEALKYYKLFLQYNKDAENVAQVQDKIRSLEK